VRVGWGILGCGRIATGAVAPAIGWSDNGTLVAVASRTPEVAASKARQVGAERSYASYEALLDDSRVHAVYIGLPNGLHEEWCVRAAEAGKHVLCEKSLTLNARSARRIAGSFARSGLRLVEAFMYRHHPQWRVVRDHLAAVGKVRLVRACLAGSLPQADDHRWSSTLGGGALFYVTCYAVNAARFVLGSEPVRVAAVAEVTAEGVDVTSQASLEFPGGVLASASGSLRAERDQSVVIVGSEGLIEVVRPFIPGWEAAEVWVEQGGERRRIEVGGANHFLHEVEHFASIVLDPKRPMAPAENGVANVAACEAIGESFRRGVSVAVAEV